MSKTQSERAGAEHDAEVDTGPKLEPGPGELALAKLLGPEPPPHAAVLDLLYAYPGERAAMMTRLHATLGNAYVQTLFAADARGELAPAAARDQAEGPPSLPAPKEAGPGLTAFGQLLARGAPRVDEVVRLLDANASERDLLIDAIGTYLGPAFLAEVRQAMGDLRMDWKRLHLVAGDPQGAGSYFDASKDRQGAAWRTGLFGGQFTGELGGKKQYDVAWRQDEDHFVEASKQLDGGRWKLGDFTGRFAGGRLDSAYAFSDSDQLKLFHDTKSGFGTLGFYREGELAIGEFAVQTKGEQTSYGLQRRFAGDDGVTRTVGLRHIERDGYSREALTYDHDGKDFDAQTYAGVGGDGGLTAGFATQHRLGEGTTLGTRAGIDGEDWHAQLDASQRWNPEWSSDVSSRVDQDRYRASVGTSYAHGPWSTRGRVGAEGEHGGVPTFTGTVSEQYRDKKWQHELMLRSGVRDGDVSLEMLASTDVDLGRGFYAGGWGGWNQPLDGKEAGSVGGSLTFTPHERAALTLAGVIDGEGTFDTRLQLDVFRSKIRDVGALTSRRKDALISVFIGYGNGTMLDARYGEADQEMRLDDEGTLRFGVGVSF